MFRYYTALSLILLAACHKKDQTLPPVETADQKLVKVLKKVSHTNDMSQNLYDDSIVYVYDAAGRVISEGLASEGIVKYTRDARGRIILMEGVCYENQQPLDTLRVFYKNDTSTEIAYKTRFSSVIANYDYTPTIVYDSLVYVHKNGRIAEVICYESVNYAPFYIWSRQEYSYDDNGRLLQLRRRIVIPNQLDRISRNYMFTAYDTKVNAIPQGDEARADMVLWDTDNMSANNIISEKYYGHGTVFNAEKVYEYRADGRPRSCAVTINGISAIVYHYYYQ